MESVSVFVQTGKDPGNARVIILLPWKVIVAPLKELTLVGFAVFTLGIEKSALGNSGPEHKNEGIQMGWGECLPLDKFSRHIFVFQSHPPFPPHYMLWKMLWFNPRSLACKTTCGILCSYSPFFLSIFILLSS